MNNNALRTACGVVGTAAGGTWQSIVSDQELGRMFRELREIRDKLYEAGYSEQVQAMFR